MNKIIKSISKEYEIKNLYVAYPSLISEKDGGIFYNYEEEQLEEIVVLKKDEFFVENVINGRIYGIFQKFTFETIKKFLNQYMVNELVPLELCLDNFVKSTIIMEEILKMQLIEAGKGRAVKTKEKIEPVIEEPKDKVYTAKFLAGGDALIHKPVRNSGKQADGTWNYTSQFDMIRDILAERGRTDIGR